MSIEQVLKELRQEGDKIEEAIRALSALTRTRASLKAQYGSKDPGVKAAASATRRKTSGPRKMSAAARRKISLAQKARWAKMKIRKKA